MAEGVKLSGHVICQNSAGTIKRCLKSLSFCDEIVVVDGLSTDGTLGIAKRLATTVGQRKFDGFGAQRNRAWELSRGEWSFWLDSDAEATGELAREIRETLDSGANLPDAFLVRRRFHYPPAWGANAHYWQSAVRLFRKAAGRWDPAKDVHEAREIPGPRGKLEGVIEHWPWEGLDDIVARSVRYSSLAAREMVKTGGRGGRGGAVRAVSHAFFRFLRHYFRDGGWRQGSAGFFFSAALALEPFLKYARAWELTRLREREEKAEEGKPREREGEPGEEKPQESPPGAGGEGGAAGGSGETGG